MTIYNYPKEWHLLQQESFLIRACLANGLTELRNANLGNKGLFYSGLFNISIGLERLMKVTLIINHMHANNLECLDPKTIRDYKHDLQRLLKDCQTIAHKASLPCDLQFTGSKIKNDIIDLLYEYSHKCLRYYNLKAFGENESRVDTLEQWGKIINDVYLSEVPKSKKRKIGVEAQIVSSMLNGTASVHYSDLDKEGLSIDEIALKPMIIESTAPYINWHIIEIVKSINVVQFHVAELVYEESDRKKLPSPKIPYVDEFYDFLNGDKSYHLHKKRWP